MLKETVPGVYQSELLSQQGIQHGFSSRSFGDMRGIEPRHKFKQALGLSSYRLVAAEQIHGDSVHVVTQGDFGKTVPLVDALVFRNHESNVHIALGIIVADCAPMLFADLQARVIGVAHAGWKGTLSGITKNTITEMRKLGSNASDIIVSIGPHIGMCHYDVPEERARKFLEAFGNDPKVASFFENCWHVDIGWANYRQLIGNGIVPEHIDAPPTCTACQIDTYFSFRKDSKETFGEIMGVIGFK